MTQRARERVNASTGSVVQKLDYDEFGNMNVLVDTQPPFQPFGFTGGIHDRDTGLVRFGARDYDPAIGRWTTRDPILFWGGQTNLYVYVGNDPVNRWDSTGLIDFFFGFDLDAVFGGGFEVGAGVVVDFDNLWDSGFYGSFGVSMGANVGYGVGGGVCDEIEGGGESVDFNAKAFSPTFMFANRRLNGVALAIGPGLGASATGSQTRTISVGDIRRWMTGWFD